MTEAELLYGIAKAGIGEQRMRMLNWFLQLVTIHPWGRAEAAVYGKLRAKQEAAGQDPWPARHADRRARHRARSDPGHER